MTVQATPPVGETGASANSETAGTPPVTPPASNGGSNSETIAKSEYDKLAQERNMYRNQLTDKEKAYQEELDKTRKEVDDLRVKADEERINREKLEQSISDRERQEAVKTKESEMLSGYPDGVRELAKDLGVNLSDAEDEEAVDLYKQKLDKLNAKVGGETPPKKQPPVGGNNGKDPDPKPKPKAETDEIKDLEAKLKGVTF